MTLDQYLKPTFLEVLEQLLKYFAERRELQLRKTAQVLCNLKIKPIHPSVKKRWHRFLDTLQQNPPSLEHIAIRLEESSHFTQWIQMDPMRSTLSKEEISILQVLVNYHRDIVSKFLTPEVLRLAIATGQPQAKTALGVSSNQIFDAFNTDPTILEKYALAFAVQNLRGNQPIVQYFSKHLTGNFLDVGGGVGDLSYYLLQNSRFSSISVYETPDSLRQLKDLRKHVLSSFFDKILWVSGDFFSNPNEVGLPGVSPSQTYDVINLGWVLHDWNDEKSIYLLKCCRKHLAQQGTLTVLERIITPENQGKMVFSDMVILSMAGGVERDLQEYQSLFHKAGLRIKEVTYNSKGRDILALESTE